MAFPFPSKDRDVNACRSMYGREVACFDSWRNEERSVAGVVLAVVVGTAVWKVSLILLFHTSPIRLAHKMCEKLMGKQIVVIYMQSRRSSWADDAVAREDGERRALEYHDTEGGGYRDQPDVEDVEDGETVPAIRVVPSRLRDDDEERRDF